MKKWYCVGTGPGDKELLTLKAVRIIKDAQIIFAPNNRGKNMALDTVKDYISYIIAKKNKHGGKA